MRKINSTMYLKESSCWILLSSFNISDATSLVVWSESLTTNHEVPGSIPGSTLGIFLEGEDSRGGHGLGRLVEFRFKAPPGTTSPSITTHTRSGQRNCSSWASQPQKSATLLPCPGGRTTKSTKGHVVALGGGNSRVCLEMKFWWSKDVCLKILWRWRQNTSPKRRTNS